MIYNAPIQDMLFLIRECVGIDKLNALPGYEEVDIDLIEAVLEEAGKFASSELLAINRDGDEHGAVFSDGNVTTPPGFKEAYTQKTIAHNTLVVDAGTQHGGNTKAADAAHPWQVFTQLDNTVQAVSAADTTAYPGVALQRTLALLQLDNSTSVLLDVYSANSDQTHQYDLPFHYKGQRIALQPDIVASTSTLQPLGNDEGYQYRWLNGSSEATSSSAFTLLNQDRFYTVTSCSNQPYQVVESTLGANDPQQNLRRESAFMYRSNAASQTWVSAIEAHGNYNTIHERTEQAHSNIQSLAFAPSTDNAQLEITLELSDGRSYSINIDPRLAPASNTTNRISIEEK